MSDFTDEVRVNVSGVRIVTSTRGYDISVHVLVGCTQKQLEQVGDLAMDEYMRMFQGMKARIEAALAGVDGAAVRKAKGSDW
jgi:hypothetical protein